MTALRVTVFVVWQAFGESSHMELLKELLGQIFSTPMYHPKSKPFIDHIIHFGVLDGHIWFRNYQVTLTHSCTYIRTCTCTVAAVFKES